MPIGRIVVVWVTVLLTMAACSGDDAGDAGDDAGDAGRFCEITIEVEQLASPFDLPPNQAREAVRKSRELLEEGIEVAPDEIRASVEVIFGSLTPFFEVLEAADFDSDQIDPAEMDAIFLGAFPSEAAQETAGNAIANWIAANCSP